MTNAPARIRLDQALTERGLAQSRSRARDMIARNCVRVAGKVVSKAGAAVAPDADLQIDDPARHYVSRAAMKLISALDATGFEVAGRKALDLGASTGGFTQVLLERGASHIWSVDVGHGQMVRHLADHPKVTLMEGTNARNLRLEQIGVAPDVIVSDVSFVSLVLAAEPALLFAAPNAFAALLVKPQFEVGRDGIGKGGIVTDQALVDTTLGRIKDWFCDLPGWRLVHFSQSPIQGGDGNVEYLLCGLRDEATP